MHLQCIHHHYWMHDDLSEFKIYILFMCYVSNHDDSVHTISVYKINSISFCYLPTMQGKSVNLIKQSIFLHFQIECLLQISIKYPFFSNPRVLRKLLHRTLCKASSSNSKVPQVSTLENIYIERDIYWFFLQWGCSLEPILNRGILQHSHFAQLILERVEMHIIEVTDGMGGWFEKKKKKRASLRN